MLGIPQVVSLGSAPPPLKLKGTFAGKDMRTGRQGEEAGRHALAAGRSSFHIVLLSNVYRAVQC